jgi:hypothetical protein
VSGHMRAAACVRLAILPTLVLSRARSAFFCCRSTCVTSDQHLRQTRCANMGGAAASAEHAEVRSQMLWRSEASGDNGKGLEQMKAENGS